MNFNRAFYYIIYRYTLSYIIMNYHSIITIGIIKNSLYLYSCYLICVEYIIINHPSFL